jgi:hypothetical protein
MGLVVCDCVAPQSTDSTTYVRAHTRFLAGVLDPKDKRSENLLDPRSRSRSRYENLLDPKDVKTSWFQRYKKPFGSKRHAAARVGENSARNFGLLEEEKFWNSDKF